MPKPKPARVVRPPRERPGPPPPFPPIPGREPLPDIAPGGKERDVERNRAIGPPAEGRDKRKEPLGYKKALASLETATAFGNINTPGLSPDMVEKLLRAGRKAGIPAKDVLRFVQSPALGSVGNVPEGTLSAVIDAMMADPQALVSALRLRDAMRRAGTAGQLSGAGSFQSQLFDLAPGLRDAYLGALGHKLVDSNGDGIMDRVVPIDAEAEEGQEIPAAEPFTTQFAQLPPEEFLQGGEPQQVLNESVAKMLETRARRSEATQFYGDTFSYADLIGEE